jgi:glutamate/tyrosine decarboxylase-like PLP-dependent enzyme
MRRRRAGVIHGAPMSDSLDPADWSDFRRVLHEAVDVAVDHLAGVAERPVWQPMPPAVTGLPAEPLPLEGCSPADLLGRIRDGMLPHAAGNTHPRFFGWVHGAGNAAGILGELMAAVMNCNNGGRDHVGIYVERAVIAWCREIFGFPGEAAGLLTTGTSVANLLALRTALVAARARRPEMPLEAFTAYTSVEAHSCLLKAMRLMGLGDANLRLIDVDADRRMQPAALRAAVAADVAAGRVPFCVAGTAGTVNTGAIDPLESLRAIADQFGLWFHVDGAFGAFAILADSHRPQLAALATADSLSFDFHKWLHVPYDAGCVLVRDGAAQRRAFALRPDYLAGLGYGLAGGDPWFCDYGVELSRGLRALKVWTTIQGNGLLALGRQIQKNIDQAGRFAARVAAHPEFALAAPSALNIVCFEYLGGADRRRSGDGLTDAIVAELYDSGLAAPSTTVLGGRRVIRVNLTNHRTRDRDLDLLFDAVLVIGRRLLAQRASDPAEPVLAAD